MDSKLQERWTGLRTTSIVTFIDNPKYFKRVLDNKVVEDTPKFLELGTQTHMYLLEPKEFKKTYTFLDYTKPRGEIQTNFCEYIANGIRKNKEIEIKDLSIEAYKSSYKVNNKSEDKISEESLKLYESLKDYIKFLTYSGKKEVITFGTLNYLKEVKQVVEEHKLASKLIFEDLLNSEKHYNELFVLWEFKGATVNELPLVIKSTVDKLIVDHDKKIIKLVDLKTTNDITDFKYRFYDPKHPGYKIQLACYWFAIETWFRENFKEYDINEYSRETYLVAIQTKNPYKDYPVNCEVFSISEESLSEGLSILEKKLPDIAWHFENNLWDHEKAYYEGNGINSVL